MSEDEAPRSQSGPARRAWSQTAQPVSELRAGKIAAPNRLTASTCNGIRRRGARPTALQSAGQTGANCPTP